MLLGWSYPGTEGETLELTYAWVWGFLSALHLKTICRALKVDYTG